MVHVPAAMKVLRTTTSGGVYSHNNSKYYGQQPVHTLLHRRQCYATAADFLCFCEW